MKDELIPKSTLAKVLKTNERNPLVEIVQQVTRLKAINKLYAQVSDKRGEEFVDGLFDQLKVTTQFKKEQLDLIPKEGPLVVVCNHPFGALDGLMALKILLQVRSDIKVMANFILSEVKPISDYFLSVNPFESEGNKNSRGGVRASLQHIQSGGCLIVFPAGEVSTLPKGKLRQPVDKRWADSVIKLIQKTTATVLPIYFYGDNSYLFHLLGKIHPQLRTAALPAELLRKRNKELVVEIGRPILHKDWSVIDDVAQLNRFFRSKVYALSYQFDVRRSFFAPRLWFKVNAKSEEVGYPAFRQDVLREIEQIEDAMLLDQSGFACYAVKAHRIPNLLHEVGRQREITFREVGEGTGKSLDLDEYDFYYYHLILWHKENQELAGAYRIGLGSEIIELYGKKGFYTNSLFKMKNEFKPYLRRSIELGRSFVVSKYQRQRWPLFLLWQGITIFMDHFKDVKYIIGPVSMSDQYQRLSKELMIQFLLEEYGDKELAQYVKPRNRIVMEDIIDREALLLTVKKEIKQMDKLIGQIEPMGLSMPILYKKYLAQNAKIIAFNRDPLFNNAIDGFMMLDIEKMPRES
jgi:putative hemolysin